MAEGFFSREAGQKRRAALEQGLMHYVPPELRGWLGAASMFNPVTDMEQAGQKARIVASPDATGQERFNAGVGMVTDMATVVAPAYGASKVGTNATAATIESLLGFGAPAREGLQDAGRRFAADESGALRLYPGDYIGQHSAPSLDVGASLDNPTVMFGGDDIYSPNAMRYFGTGMDNADRESLAAISRAKGKPGRSVTVYRAVPKDAPNEIGAGDWVSTSKAYAKDHGEANLGGRGNYKIVKETVSAGELATDGNSLNEWGFWPSRGRLEYALTEGRVKKADRAKIEEYLKTLSAPDAPPSKADEIAAMLRGGRASEITDDMMGALDPNDNMRLFDLYNEGATGMPMPMDEASRMARAREMGFTDDAYHATSKEFAQFVPSEFRGASFFGPTPEGAAKGASASANEGVGSGTGIIIPARVDTAGVDGLGAYPRRDMNEFRQSLPDRIYTEQEVDALMASDKAPLRGDWSYFFDDLTDYEALRIFRDNNPDAPIPDGIIKFRPKDKIAYSAGLRSNLYGRQFSHYSDGMSERPISDYVKEQGNTGFTMQDESGLALAVTDPTTIRSRFARFDPRLKHLANLSAGVGGVAYLGNQGEDQKAAQIRAYLEGL